MANTYELSDGTRLKKSTIDRLVKECKDRVSQAVINDQGYLVCEDCRRNDCQPVERSHNISVDMCQKLGVTEYAYADENITHRGQPCHKIYDSKPNRDLINKLLARLKPNSNQF
ncbi:MAG: hypothetical protein H7282_04860 [Cytophagaceae bacterium]|nr:hypothetical protein [Cytophagaceae bacterium]